MGFERYGAELATIAPGAVEAVLEHYGMVGRLREGIRALGPPGVDDGEALRTQRMDLCIQGGPAISRSAVEALGRLDAEMQRGGSATRGHES